MFYAISMCVSFFMFSVSHACLAVQPVLCVQLYVIVHARKSNTHTHKYYHKEPLVPSPFINVLSIKHTELFLFTPFSVLCWENSFSNVSMISLDVGVCGGWWKTFFFRGNIYVSGNICFSSFFCLLYWSVYFSGVRIPNRDY